MAACLRNIDEADAQLSRFLDVQDVPVDRFALRILLREALLNAVTHGSAQDEQREVRMDVTLEPAAVEMAVEDDGPGFAWIDRGTDFDICGDGGRGLALMQMYSTEMSFNNRGNRVVLRRAYDRPGAADASMSGE